MLPDQLAQLFALGRDDLVLFSEKILGMPMHEGQQKWLRKSTKKINDLNPGNRWGKTIVTAVKHIHKSFYKIGIGQGDMAGWQGVDYLTANIAPDHTMAEPCFKAIKQILQGRFPIPQPDGSVKNNVCLITWFLDEKRIINTPPRSITYSNGSKTEFKSLGADKGDSLQGKPYGYISYDEGGRSDHLEKEMWDNIIPRLADYNGPFDLVSTPDQNSPSLLYHSQLFQRGIEGADPDVYAQEGSIDENTFMSPERRAAQKRLYEGNPIAPQVLYGKFVFAGAKIYPLQDILDACDEKLNDPQRYIEGHQYVIGIDTAIGSDEMVYTVLDVTDETCFKIVRKVACKGNSKSPQLHLDELINLFELYNKAANVKMILETFNGESARFYMDLPRNMQRVTKCFGTWQPPTTSSSKDARKRSNKADILISLRKKLAAKEIKIPMSDATLKSQLSIYQEDDRKIPTDHVISLCLAVWRATDGRPKTTKIEFVAVQW